MGIYYKPTLSLVTVRTTVNNRYYGTCRYPVETCSSCIGNLFTKNCEEGNSL